MELKTRIAQQLKTIRGITEQMLAAFETPQQWTHQVHHQANHALWFAGHVATVDDFLIHSLAPEKSAVPADYRAKFGMGSRPTAKPDDYPPVDEVREFMRQRRETLLQLLAELDEADLQRPSPEAAPDIMPDVGSMFEAAVWHEALHLGQVTVARRHLGHAPLVDAPATD